MDPGDPWYRHKIHELERLQAGHNSIEKVCPGYAMSFIFFGNNEPSFKQVDPFEFILLKVSTEFAPKENDESREVHFAAAQQPKQQQREGASLSPQPPAW